MKNILAIIALFGILLGCASENKMAPGKWSVEKNDDGSPVTQVIYTGDSSVCYRIRYKEGNYVVEVEVDNAKADLTKGQTIDVEGKMIKISITRGVHNQRRYAVGTYARVKVNKVVSFIQK